MNKPLREKVFETIQAYDDLTKQEKCAVCVILYKYCANLLSDDKNHNSISSIVNSYAGSLVNLFKNMRSKYLSYTLILKEVNNINKDNFTLYTDAEVDIIYELYQNKTQIVPFSINYYSQYMYKVESLTHYQYGFLSNIHKTIMKPIAAYYMDKYSIADSALEILSAEDDDGTVGRRIIFNIKGVNNSIIRNDIINGNIPINYYSVEVSGDYIVLITS